jgi:hypothetical protein
MKIAVASANLDRYRALGITWNIVDAWQDLDGPDEFRRLERAIAEHEQRGIQVAIRLLETPEIYDRIRAGGDAAADSLRAYGAWTGAIARRFGSRVRYYLVSNEADHDIGYNRAVYRPFRRISAEEYRELWPTTVCRPGRWRSPRWPISSSAARPAMRWSSGRGWTTRCPAKANARWRA